MKESPQKIRLIFQSTRENIPGILKKCLEHISRQTENSPIDSDVMSKIKWVITEMLTNAVKHSGVDHCMLTVLMDPDRLTLEKEDTGEPLMLVEHPSGKRVVWPLPKAAAHINFQIYHNGTDSLRVKTNDARRAYFFTEQMSEGDMPGGIDDTSEHFGLLIMVKASEEFTYEYDPISKINRFRTTFNLKQSQHEAQV